MKTLFLIIILNITTGCVNRIAEGNLYPFDLVNKNSPSTKEVAHYPNQNGPVIFYLHGNGENIASLEKSGMTKALQQFGYVTVPEYPGLGPVVGVPSQKTIMETVMRHFRATKDDWSGTGRKIFIVGRSLGAAVAAQLSKEGADGLVLISPWTSTRDAAKASKLGFLAGLASGFIKDNEWNTLEAVRGFKGKSAVIHGKSDDMIPFEHGGAVAQALGVSVLSVNAGHNDLFAKKEFWVFMGGVLGK